jgi:hypothetical protein
MVRPTPAANAGPEAAPGFYRHETPGLSANALSPNRTLRRAICRPRAASTPLCRCAACLEQHVPPRTKLLRRRRCRSRGGDHSCRCAQPATRAAGRGRDRRPIAPPRGAEAAAPEHDHQSAEPSRGDGRSLAHPGDDLLHDSRCGVVRDGITRPQAGSRVRPAYPPGIGSVIRFVVVEDTAASPDSTDKTFASVSKRKPSFGRSRSGGQVGPRYVSTAVRFTDVSAEGSLAARSLRGVRQAPARRAQHRLEDPARRSAANGGGPSSTSRRHEAWTQRPGVRRVGRGQTPGTRASVDMCEIKPELELEP